MFDKMKKGRGKTGKGFETGGRASDKEKGFRSSKGQQKRDTKHGRSKKQMKRALT